MKSLVLILSLLVSVAASAKIEILRDPASAEVNGFSEALYGRSTKSCFSGSANQVCSHVKGVIKRVNNDLSLAGASQRFDVVTCAQNPNRTMVIYSVRPAREFAKVQIQKTKKTVFIDRCSGENQQLALSLSNE